MTPADEQFAEVGGGIQLCYLVEGDPGADPLVLLAGLGQQLNVWPASLVDGLIADRFRVVRFDNRDIGRSSRHSARPPGRQALVTGRFSAAQYTLADMAADTVGLLDALGIRAAHLVGMSMGGMIGQTIAAHYPDRALSLTSIMSTTGSRRVGWPAPSTYTKLLGPPPRTREAAGDRTVAMMRHVGSHGFPFDEPQVRATGLEGWDRGGGANPAGFARQIGSIQKSGNRTAELRRIAVPTLVIHGDRDRLVHPSGGRATAKAIPGARLETITGMGHDLPEGAVPQLIAAITANARRAGLGDRVAA